MPKVSPIQTSFNSGEWSPLMYGRVDLDSYRSALATCLNSFPLVQGPWTRRPGSYFVSEVKDSTKATRLVRFEFSVDQSYVLEFGDQYVRFYTDNAPVLEAAQDITAISQASPGVLTYSGSTSNDPSDGDVMYLTGIGGMTELNGQFVKVANVNTTANTFELTDMAGTNIDTSAFTAYTSGGTMARFYTVTTPYVEADLFELNFIQSADVLYIAHPDYAQRKLYRQAAATLTSPITTSVTVATGEIKVAYDELIIGTGGTLTVDGEVDVVPGNAWTLETITFLDGPYMITNTEDTTLTLGGTTGSVSVTASSTVGINGGDGFLLTDVGRLIRWKDGAGNWTWLTITAYTSTTVVTATISGPDASATTATVNWRLGVWSDTTGYPGCVTFYEDRLCWAAATDFPQRIDMSKTGDYENMAPSNAAGTVAADNAVSITLNSNDVQYIRWMTNDEKGLVVGTSSSEWIVRPSSQTEALSPTNVAAKESTFHGSAAVAPLKAGKATLFMQRAGRKLRELAYVYEVDGFRSPDMTLLSQHVTTSRVKDMAYQQEPYSIVWTVRNDGVIAAFTYEREQKVLAWHRHILGGYSNAAKTADPIVESVCAIPSADGTRDEVWMIVRRYIGGRSRRYVEYLKKSWERGDDQEDAFHVDAGMTYDGASASSLTGAHHLAGETVKVWADGALQPDVTVTATGGITLTRAASVVHVGYGYNSDGKCLRPEAGAADGTAQGKTQRSHKVVFRLHDTAGIKVGANFNSTGSGKLTALPFRQTTDATATAVPLFSGDKDDFTWDGDYTTENYVCWRMDHAGPGTVLAIMPKLHTQDA